jgi:hypothetical protein
MAKKITKKEKDKKNEEKRKEKRKREKERRENERKIKSEIQKRLNKLNATKKEGKRKKERKIRQEEKEEIKQLKTELKKENNTIINNNVTINIRTPSNSNISKSESSSRSYLDNSSYCDSDVSIPEIPKHPERDDTYKNYIPTALPYENVLLNRDFLRDINKQLKEENFIRDNEYSFHDFCLYYKLKKYFKTKKEEKKAYPNISKYLNFIKKYKRLEYENRFLKEYNKKIRRVYKKNNYERSYKKSYFSSSSFESDDSILSHEETIKQQKKIRMKMGPESDRIRQEVDSFIKKIESKKRKETEDKKRRKDGKLRRKRKGANKDWTSYK